MADSHVSGSSDKITKKSNICWDFVKINECIKSTKIVYDGTRVKWCDNYESLKVFIESAFCQQGKWRASGGSSKSFDAFSAEFRVIWYPGKHNTLTFSGSAGELAKECLMKLCGGHSIDYNESLENINLELDILKSKVDSMQVLLDSQRSPITSEVGDLSNEITLLKLDLEEEKLQNRLLERAVERLQQEIDKINIYRSGSVGFAKDANLINNGEIAEACVDGSQISEDGFDDESVKTLLETPYQLVSFPVGNEVIGDREVLSSDDRSYIQQRSDEENDVIIIENNDQLSTSDQICIQQHNEKDKVVIKINDHEVLNSNDQTCIQQHSDEENDVIVNTVNTVNSQLIPHLNKEVSLHSYESFPALNPSDSDPVSGPADRNYRQFTSSTDLAKSQEHYPTFSPRRPFRDRCYNIPSYRTGYRQYSLEWLVHLSVVSRVTRSKKYQSESPHAIATLGQTRELKNGKLSTLI